MKPYSLADRFVGGTGPAPRTFRVARDPAIPRAALGETAVCGTCGTVYRTSSGHYCSGKAAR